VVRPGHDLLRRIFQRGIDSGEFAPMDVDHAIYSVVAPMVFLMLWKHSAMVCVDGASALDPEKYVTIQADVVIHGLSAHPGRPSAPPVSPTPPKIEGLS
jgi:TetR/AcrR family transcriptional regulator